TSIGPNWLELCPPGPITAMFPVCALVGTVTTRPSFEVCRCALGELRAIRAFQDRGNATASPFSRPCPCSSSVPWVETSCCLVEQLLAGTQRAAVILTVVLELAAGACPPLERLPVAVPPVGPRPPVDPAPPVDPCPPVGACPPAGTCVAGWGACPPDPFGAWLCAPPGEVPPETAVDAGAPAAREPTSTRASSDIRTMVAAAEGRDRLWTPELSIAGGAGRAPDLTGYGVRNRATGQKLRCAGPRAYPDRTVRLGRRP